MSEKRGTPLRHRAVMSPMARALEKRFDAVCRAEIARMTVKTRGLTPAERSALEDLACQVVERSLLAHQLRSGSRTARISARS